MPVFAAYASKAEKYARYRWRYDPRAIEAIFNLSSITRESTAIELGAGTGILTRSIAGRVRKLFAIEPDPYMNRWIREGLPEESPVSVITALTEAVPLAAHRADVIIVGQAIHWFEPLLARQEIMRLLKGQGWLALLRNYGIDRALNQALSEVFPPREFVPAESQAPSGEPPPPGYYYGHHEYERMNFPFTYRQDWGSFMGGITSASYAPDESNPAYASFEAKVRQVFNRYSEHGWLETRGETEMLLGRVR